MINIKKLSIVFIIFIIVTILFFLVNHDSIISYDSNSSPPSNFLVENFEDLNNNQSKLSKKKKTDSVLVIDEVILSEVASEIEYYEDFDISGTLEEVGRIWESQNNKWWLNSGGYLKFEDGIGKTIQGRIEKDSYWQKKYSIKANNTDGGFRPQNIFRLLTRDKWDDHRSGLSFRITSTDTSDSGERDGSNGVLLFGRYINQDNLYYAGIRVDGSLIIKKKKNGVYYTMSNQKIFSGNYNKKTNPNLLPLNKWMRIYAEYTNLDNNSVLITVGFDENLDGKYEKVITVTDYGKKYGGESHTTSGLAGIRTDFMDVEFDDYFLKEI